MGKGEIAHYEQFLLFPQCFQRLVLQTRQKQGLFGKGLSRFPYTASVISWQQFTLFRSFQALQVLVSHRVLKCLAWGHSNEKSGGFSDG